MANQSHNSPFLTWASTKPSKRKGTNYDQKKSLRGKVAARAKTAKVAMVSKLSVRLYRMMRKEWDYAQWVKFGSHSQVDEECRSSSPTRFLTSSFRSLSICRLLEQLHAVV